MKFLNLIKVTALAATLSFAASAAANIEAGQITVNMPAPNGSTLVRGWIHYDPGSDSIFFCEQDNLTERTAKFDGVPMVCIEMSTAAVEAAVKPCGGVDTPAGPKTVCGKEYEEMLDEANK